jgi:ketosteroid isomerase-like protein
MTVDPFNAFLAYAEAFEHGYSSGDWRGALEPHLADDIVWHVAGVDAPIGGTFAGPAECLDAIAVSTASFDRRFAIRKPRPTTGPTPIPGGIHMVFAFTYVQPGVGEFTLTGDEWDLFDTDGRLVMHTERIHNADEALAYIRANDAQLEPATSRPSRGDAFRAAVESHDLDALRASLADDVVFHSPIRYQPFHGRDIVAGVLSIPAQVFAFGDEFRYTRAFAGTDGWQALFFEAQLPSGRWFEGVDYLRVNDSGLVAELRVMMRPSAQVAEFAAAANEIIAGLGATA